ncbi:hypothetical protein TCAL_06991 [Tigriopus californicus]|uniref:Uncharacterized protein n=1 Tax=Tigriopus californicus TaxID=6832 RepID=A0A553P6P7_TIGCA|nr:uncharacterized protein LOC131878012 [Tigriopus californicus]TRY73352.1 hypothetical protein TCAL_06991 [Tigriopus californicus]|eukprot:TCALIF_06991-PA protein Name:"Protein of unknown function" AED:0.00 eAED:0.00 QI:201/1/1/1/0/0/2/835/129
MLTTTTTTSNLSTADDIELSRIPDIQVNSARLAPDHSCETLTTIESPGTEYDDHHELEKHSKEFPGDFPIGPQRSASTDTDFKPSFKSRLKWPCGMTNFHFSLCIGVVGFAIFWLLLLLRIYLPEEYFQ